MRTLLHCMLSSSVDLTNRSRQAHGVRCKLMKDSQEGHSCEIISWVHSEVNERLQNELAARFHVSLLCASCKLKSFTGILPGYHSTTGYLSTTRYLSTTAYHTVKQYHSTKVSLGATWYSGSLGSTRVPWYYTVPQYLDTMVPNYHQVPHTITVLQGMYHCTLWYHGTTVPGYHGAPIGCVVPQLIRVPHVIAIEVQIVISDWVPQLW